MNRLPLALVGLLLLAGASCSPADVKVDYAAQTRGLAQDLKTRAFDRVAAQFTPEVAKVLDAAKLEATWDGLAAQVGEFDSVESVRQEAKGNAHLVFATCKFARARLVLVVGYESSGKIATISFVTPESLEEWKPSAYVKAEKFTEREVTVKTASWDLPGSLTVPKGTGTFPAIVLVHGSGPNDRDESAGPNKMFKDLAWGLASRGVAVLRYEKRTRLYPTRMSADPKLLTVADETVDDARSAVALLATTPGIDKKRIFVAGHSLGAYLGPRIVQGQKEIAGLIALAGNTRPMEDLVVEQIRYIAALDGEVSDEEKTQIAAAEECQSEFRNPDLKPGMSVTLLGSPLPASYVLDLRGYDPGAVAAGLNIPLLIAQGGRDYQVRVVDFDGWKKALAGHRNAKFKVYPALNHHFMPGKGPSSPAEYQSPNHVPEQVIKDLADWISHYKPSRN